MLVLLAITGVEELVDPHPNAQLADAMVELSKNHDPITLSNISAAYFRAYNAPTTITLDGRNAVLDVPYASLNSCRSLVSHELDTGFVYQASVNGVDFHASEDPTAAEQRRSELSDAKKRCLNGRNVNTLHYIDFELQEIIINN